MKRVMILVASIGAPAIPAAASANPYHGKLRAVYPGAYIECHIDRAYYGWSLGHALRVTRGERRRWAMHAALQGCRDGWRHGR